jgi:2'-5' RNA ligase
VDGERLRLFVALGVPEREAEELADLAHLLAGRGIDARANGARELHVTLSFCGNVATSDLEVVVEAMHRAASAIPGPCRCALRHPDAFGHGRVLGVDVAIDLHAVLDPVRDRFLVDVADVAPQVDQRPWRPHLSLIRVGRRGTLPVVDDEVRDRLARTAWVAQELRLYASLPGPAGSTYRVIHAARLGAPTRRG